MLRIYVDFNSETRDPQRRVSLGHVGLPDGASLPKLTPGERVILFDEEMEVEATVEYDAEDHHWLAAPAWSTMRDFAR